MPRPVPAAAQEWAAAYARGESAVSIAASAGVHPTTVTRALRLLGAERRPRGTRIAVDERDLLRELGDDEPSPTTIAHRLGVSRNAARSALRRAGVIPTTGVPMTAAQTRRLASLARRTPRGRGAHYDLRSDAGQRMIIEAGRLFDRGVHLDELGMVLGVSGQTVRRWLRSR